jgi:hypothetical protein
MITLLKNIKDRWRKVQARVIVAHASGKLALRAAAPIPESLQFRETHRACTLLPAMQQHAMLTLRRVAWVSVSLN